MRHFSAPERRTGSSVTHYIIAMAPHVTQPWDTVTKHDIKGHILATLELHKSANSEY